MGAVVSMIGTYGSAQECGPEGGAMPSAAWWTASPNRKGAVQAGEGPLPHTESPQSVRSHDFRTKLSSNACFWALRRRFHHAPKYGLEPAVIIPSPIQQSVLVLNNKLHQASNACSNNSVLDYFLFRFCRKRFAFQHGLSISCECYHCSDPHTVNNVSVGAVTKFV